MSDRLKRPIRDQAALNLRLAGTANTTVLTASKNKTPIDNRLAIQHATLWNTNSATLTMSTDCDYVFNELVPEKVPVSIRVVKVPANRELASLIPDPLKDGLILKESCENGKIMSKNAIRMRERRKNPDHRRREDERRKLQLRETRKNQKEAKMLEISPLSVLPETTANIQKKTGELTKDYIVQKEVSYVEYTTYVHEKVESTDKENAGLVVYRTDCDTIKQAWPIR